MFTGIIESLGTVEEVKPEGTNLHYKIKSSISSELKIDQSVAHNGVCLTVVELDGDSHTVTAIDETLKRSNLGTIEPGSVINLERCMPANGRYDGHIVQGHVDLKANLQRIDQMDGSWVFEFELDEPHKGLIVEKGSICVNGVSLTVASVSEQRFSVAIIPYTFDHTGFSQLKVGDYVNIEYDVLGKYVAAMLEKRGI